MTNEVKNFLAAVKAERVVNSNNIVFLFTTKKTAKAKMDLIKTGLFTGSESVMRLRVSKDRYGDLAEFQYSVITEDNKSFSWESGTSGYTCVSDHTRDMGHLIYDTVVEKYGPFKNMKI